MSFPLGTHRARAIDAALGMTSTGKEQIAIMFERVDTGERINWYGYFTDGTIDRTIESLQYIGWTGSDLSEFLGGLPAGCDHEVDIVVEEEEDARDGTMRAKVRWINRAGSGVAIKDRLTDDQARSFAARMRSKIGAAQAKAGNTTKQRATAGTAAALARNQGVENHFNDDEIPF